MPFTPSVDVTTEFQGTNAVSGVGGNVVNSVVVSDFDVYNPRELTQIFYRHGHPQSYRLFLDALGFSRGVDAPTTGHYEKPRVKDLLYVGTIDQASLGPGTTVTVSLQASAHYQAPAPLGGASARASYPLEGEIVEFASGRAAQIQNKVTSGANHQIDLVPTDTTYDLATDVVASSAYFISTTAHAEGSDAPAGRTPRIIKYTNGFQNIKSAVYATGSSLTNSTYFQLIPGKVNTYHYMAKMDMMIDYEHKHEGALLFGQRYNNLTETVPNLGTMPVNGTEGLIQFIRGSGINQGYTSGTYGLTQFDAVSATFEGQRINNRRLCMLQGGTLYRLVENALLAQQSNDLTLNISQRYFAGDTYNTFGDQPFTEQDFLMHIGFYGLKKGGFFYAFKMLHAFNDVLGAGASGYDYHETQLIHPLGYTMNKKSNTQVPTMGYEWKEVGGEDGYSRAHVVSFVAGAGVGGAGGLMPHASNTVDQLSTIVTSEIAFHGTTPNQTMIQEPV